MLTRIFSHNRNGSISRQGRGPIAQKLHEALEGATHRANTPYKAFICEEDIRQIIVQNDELFSFEAWTEDEKTLLKEQCCQTLAALVLAGAFTAVEDLRNFFFQHGSTELKITDQDLWVSNDHDLSPLPHEIRRHFLQCQCQVKPCIVSEQDPNKTIELGSNVRLPITHEKPNIGMGGYGKVSEITLPPRCFVTRNGAVFQEDQVFALKSIQMREDFLREVRNLGILKESLTSHDRIIQHHATFIQGDTYHILLPRAGFGDLALFLNEGQDEFQDGQGYSFEKRFPAHARGHSAGDLLNQTASIADALEWLHHDLRIEGEADLYLIHMDLKPANILMMEDDTSGRKSTVGKWVLTDFGISVCKESEKDSVSQRTAVITIRDAYERLEATPAMQTQTHPRRCQGKYQAPEVQPGVRPTVGRRSDVWSLGSITAEVVAFSLEGREALKAFERLRLGDDERDDYFYLTSRDSAEGPSLRPSVRSYLSDLIGNHRECGEWLEHVVEIVLNTLKINITERPSAGEFRSLLKHVQHVFDGAGCDRKECPIPRQRNGSQADPSSLLTLTNVSLNGEIEGSPMTLPSSPSSSFSRSSTYYLERRLTTLSNQSRPRSETLSPERLGPGPYAISICPSNTYVALLSDSQAQVAQLDADSGELNLHHTIPLSTSTEWVDIELAGAFLGLKGRVRSGSSSRKKVTFYDICHSELALPTLDDDALSSLNSFAVSSNAMGALVSPGSIHIFDLRERPVKRIANGKLLPSSGNYFDCARFTALGDLIAWSYGRGDDTLYCWKFDEERKFQCVLSRISSDHYRRPRVSLIPANNLNSQECVHCLIARKDTDETFDRFVVTCIPNGDGRRSRQAAIAPVNVKLAALYQNRLLITLERQHGTRFNLYIRPIVFCDPPHVGKREVLEENVGLDFLYKMTVVQTQQRNVVVLFARNGRVKTIRFNSP